MEYSVVVSMTTVHVLLPVAPVVAVATGLRPRAAVRPEAAPVSLLLPVHRLLGLPINHWKSRLSVAEISSGYIYLSPRITRVRKYLTGSLRGHRRSMCHYCFRNPYNILRLLTRRPESGGCILSTRRHAAPCGTRLSSEALLDTRDNTLFHHGAEHRKRKTTKESSGVSSSFREHTSSGHKNHIIRTYLMYHAACTVEFQPFKRSYSQLTFFSF